MDDKSMYGNDIHQRLIEFRKKKAEEEAKMIHSNKQSDVESSSGNISFNTSGELDSLLSGDSMVSDEEGRDKRVCDEKMKSEKWTRRSMVLCGLKTLLWGLLFLGFVNIGFGAVYFVVSCLFLIWYNTKDRKRLKGEPSAYSVFNPNCESIDGTLTAEQFEQELRFGPGSVH